MLKEMTNAKAELQSKYDKLKKDLDLKTEQCDRLKVEFDDEKQGRLEAMETLEETRNIMQNLREGVSKGVSTQRNLEKDLKQKDIDK